MFARMNLNLWNVNAPDAVRLHPCVEVFRDVPVLRAMRNAYERSRESGNYIISARTNSGSTAHSDSNQDPVETAYTI